MQTILTPDDLIDVITRLKNQGYKAFVLSTDLDGSLTAPTPRKKFFKVPGTLPHNIFKTESVTPLVFEGVTGSFYATKDTNSFSKDALDALAGVSEEPPGDANV